MSHRTERNNAKNRGVPRGAGLSQVAWDAWQNKHGMEVFLMQNQEIQRSQSSVEISTNAKGDKSWKVKAYADTIEEAIELAVDADRKIQEKLGVE